MKTKSKIAVSIFMGMSLRNFVHAGILPALSEKFDVTILTASEKIKSALDTQYQVVLIKSPNRYIMKLMAWIEPFQYYAFHYSRKPLTTGKYILRDAKQFPFKSFFRRFFGKIWGALDEIIPPQSIYKKLSIYWDINLSSYDQLILLSSDLVYDKLLAAKGKQLGIPVNLVVHSWDNLPSRGYLSIVPDKLFVWNENMHEHARKYHNLDPRNIVVFGAPQFQYYAGLKDHANELSLKAVDPGLESKKFSVYCCSAARIFPDEAEFIKDFIQVNNDLGIKSVLRLHPSERHQEFRELFLSENVVFSVASDLFSAGIPKDKTLDLKSEYDQILEFVSLMKHSVCVVNLASTTTMDALVFDTPAILVNYNNNPSLKNEWNKSERWYESDHFIYLLSGSALLMAHSAHELKELIQRCQRGDFPLQEMKSLTKGFITEMNSVQVFVNTIEGIRS